MLPSLERRGEKLVRPLRKRAWVRLTNALDEFRLGESEKLGRED